LETTIGFNTCENRIIQHKKLKTTSKTDYQRNSV